MHRSRPASSQRAGHGDRERRRVKPQIRGDQFAPSPGHWLKIRHERQLPSFCELVKFFATNRSKPHAISHPQQTRPASLRIEKPQWRSADNIPTAGGFDWIDPGLFSADADRTRWNFFSRTFASRGGDVAGQAAEEGKSTDESDAMNAIFS